MSPSDYRVYADTIDYFSNLDLNNELKKFIRVIVDNLPESNSLLDVGGGSAYILNKILDQRGDISSILVEPSEDMFNLATLNRKASTLLINKTFNDALPELPVMDNILFCRSLYSLSGNIDDYDEVFYTIAKKTNPYGYLFIMEPNSLYNVSSYKKEIIKNFKIPQRDFEYHWPIVEAAMNRFNEGVLNSEFTLFDGTKLEKIANRYNFNTKFINNTIYVFRKNH